MLRTSLPMFSCGVEIMDLRGRAVRVLVLQVLGRSSRATGSPVRRRCSADHTASGHP
jgi:hypothetical protein